MLIKEAIEIISSLEYNNFGELIFRKECNKKDLNVIKQMAVKALDQIYQIQAISDEIEDGEQQDALKYRLIANVLRGERMTGEEAKRRLLNIERRTPIHTREDARDFEALEMAIKALSQEPCIYDLKNRYCPRLNEHGMLKYPLQEPTVTSTDKPMTMVYPTIVCDDAISRILARMWNCRGKHTTSIDKVKMEQIIRDELSVTQKSGKWDRSCTCSVCGKWRILESEKNDGKYKYCPNCGAKMESEEQTE